ncbi:MAG TPA: nucleoside triphosphate pyrophosphatase [Solirubrobacteraceae bacterium]|nr:nucleoside triphosphate pyrophosphatase [Solirubrobacteraceae bacterium]
MSQPLVLASASPQRRAILARLGVAFDVRPTGVAELADGDPETVALENALRKARAAADPERDELVLAVDTLVELDGRIYGKPPDRDAARETLRELSGATHTVISGLVLLDASGERTALARTSVSFRELAPSTIDWYLATDEWRERAGGYAIQGAGAALVSEISGDYENVVGLPLAALLDLYPSLLLPSPDPDS